jgi:hypothetical protein
VTLGENSSVEIKFRRSLDVSQPESTIDRLEDRIRRKKPTIKRIYIEADSLKRTRPIHNGNSSYLVLLYQALAGLDVFAIAAPERSQGKAFSIGAVFGSMPFAMTEQQRLR